MTTINGEVANFASGVKVRSASWLFGLGAAGLFLVWRRTQRSPDLGSSATSR